MTMTATAEMPATIENAVPVLSEKQKSAWLNMATAKTVLTGELTRDELAAQQLLTAVKDATDYQQIDNALEQYRKQFTVMVDKRRAFTSKIDEGIIQPLMAFEKRIDGKVNSEYITLCNKSLTLRKAAADAANLQNRKLKDIASFKAHLSNENSRRSEMLRSKIRNEVRSQYTMHLQERISPELEKIKGLIQLVTVPPAIAYQPDVLTREELSAIYAEQPATMSFEEAYKDGKKMVDEVFANFDSDLANASQAIAHVEQTVQLQDVEGQRAVESETAVNTLIHTSSAPVVDLPKIKKTIEIIDEDTEQWAKTIMGAFIVNLPNLAKYIKVKQWAKLSVGQMSDYLTKYCNETGFRIAGLSYKEIEK